jgi:succinate-semialdehyde dehydrogenase/glutarate-semialdehyde dehydrogenase
VAIPTVNPATGETLRTFDELTGDEVDREIARAITAFHEHRRTSFAERAERLRRAADIVEAETDDLARLATLEMGKTLASADGKVAKCAKGCRWFAEHTEALLAGQPHDVGDDHANVFTRYEPLGRCSRSCRGRRQLCSTIAVTDLATEVAQHD